MYQPRAIDFKEILTIDDWKIKVYTITKDKNQITTKVFEAVKSELPDWLSLKNSFNHQHDKIGFLILHFGTEGIFSIINWWVGQNMLNTHIFFSDYSNPEFFNKISGDGLAPCIWELEVINFEKKSWTENILKQQPSPKYEKYIEDNFSIII